MLFVFSSSSRWSNSRRSWVKTRLICRSRLSLPAASSSVLGLLSSSGTRFPGLSGACTVHVSKASRSKVEQATDQLRECESRLLVGVQEDSIVGDQPNKLSERCVSDGVQHFDKFEVSSGSENLGVDIVTKVWEVGLFCSPAPFACPPTLRRQPARTKRLAMQHLIWLRRRCEARRYSCKWSIRQQCSHLRWCQRPPRLSSEAGHFRPITMPPPVLVSLLFPC